MTKFELIVTTLFGIEALTVREIKKLGYEVTEVADGRITFLGDFEAVARSNMWLRTGERIFIKIGEFDVFSFDELFDGCKAIDWSYWLPRDCAFPVKGFTLKSSVFSVSDCQSIIKKSIVESLKERYATDWFPETGPVYQIEFSIIRDRATLMLDTSGDGLHKRGYRRASNAAPIRETIASAIVMLSRFSYRGILADPLCGSGTIPIEAAMIAKNIAPGLNRGFSSMNYSQIPKKLWQLAKEEALDKKMDTRLRVLASDIDADCVALTVNNAGLAGVSDVITAHQMAAEDFKSSEADGTLICNPPYGERLMDIEATEQILKKLGYVYKGLNNWTFFVITPNDRFEKLFGRRADKRRKIYNGMIKCDLYQYFAARRK